jgi:DNA-binding transcriptional regulator YiaG
MFRQRTAFDTLSQTTVSRTVFLTWVRWRAMNDTASQTVWDKRPEMAVLLERLRARRVLPPAHERKAIRQSAGASLRDVAKALDTSPASVFRWEGGANPGPRTAAYVRLLDELRRLA